jgi:ribosomal protein S14
MRKRIIFDKKYREKFLKSEFAGRLLKYLARSPDSESSVLDIWKNKSFKHVCTNKKFKTASRIRNFCILSGRGRGLSKNYLSVSRNNFKYLQALGLLHGFYKSS